MRHGGISLEGEGITFRTVFPLFGFPTQKVSINLPTFSYPTLRFWKGVGLSHAKMLCSI